MVPATSQRFNRRTRLTSSSGDIQVSGIVFDTVASAFTITASPGFTLEIDSAGVSNNSGSVQNFVSASQFGILVLGGNVTAGPGAVFTVEGGPFNGGSGGEADLSATASMGTGDFIVKGGKVDGAVGGQMDFLGSATAGNGTLTVEGGVTAGALGGRVLFLDTSHAGNATLIAQGDSPSNGGTLDFLAKSHGDKARVEVFGSGVFRVDHLKRIVTDFSVGSIEGDGSIILASFGSGAGKNLIVGGNKINATFSGVIDDGGAGGSLTVKMKRKRLVLTGANTYTGGTTIKSGTLSVSNQSGSGTGTGPVQVNGGSRGSLRGNGTIFGPVTVGDGNASRISRHRAPEPTRGPSPLRTR